MTQDYQNNNKITGTKNWKTADTLDEDESGWVDSSQEGEGDSGKGGKSGEVEFRDFLIRDKGRDDLLSFDEKKRLLSIHKDSHEIHVKKQKDLRDQRQALKQEKTSLNAYHQGLMNSSMASDYKVNPVLANAAQFSGIDRQVNSLPTENIADTNPADRNELENEYRKRYMPEQAPRFTPKPQYNG